jgi:hypothetical protein
VPDVKPAARDDVCAAAPFYCCTCA